MSGKRPLSDCGIMEMLSERYGWTPDQIRSIGAADVQQYIEIIKAKEALKKANAKIYG